MGEEVPCRKVPACVEVRGETRMHPEGEMNGADKE